MGCPCSLFFLSFRVRVNAQPVRAGRPGLVRIRVSTRTALRADQVTCRILLEFDIKRRSHRQIIVENLDPGRCSRRSAGGRPSQQPQRRTLVRPDSFCHTAGESARKRRLWGHQGAQFRIEAYNAFKHVNLGDPITDVDNWVGRGKSRDWHAFSWVGSCPSADESNPRPAKGVPVPLFPSCRSDSVPPRVSFQRAWRVPPAISAPVPFFLT
jgi:hypothetical protein